MDQRQGSAKDAGWWVLQTKPLSEKRAQANLVAQGYGVFLPEYPREFIRGGDVTSGQPHCFPATSSSRSMTSLNAANTRCATRVG